MGYSLTIRESETELRGGVIMDRFQFRKLIVYKRSLDLVVAIRPLAASIPREHMDLRWQLQRAARSVVLNLAEGAGEFSPREKARIYRISLRSAWEVVGALDLGILDGFFAPDDTKEVADLVAE